MLCDRDTHYKKKIEDQNYHSTSKPYTIIETTLYSSI